ncbi:hypothetical protein BGZ96_007384, partial [Linnemannia gamsii]
MRFQSLLLLGLSAVLTVVTAAAEPGSDIYRSTSNAVARRGLPNANVYAAEPGLDLNDEEDSNFEVEDFDDGDVADVVDGDIRRSSPIGTKATTTTKPSPKKSTSTSSKRKSKKATITAKHTLPTTTTPKR